MDEKLLIDKIKQNPKDGLMDAFELFGPLVKGIVVKTLGRSKARDIEECISDTFIKLWQSIDLYDEQRGSLRAFITIIARNTAIDRYRRSHSRIAMHPIDDMNPVAAQDTEDTAIQKINHEIVREAVNDLPEPDREIFYRRYFLAKKVNDIAYNMKLNSKRVEKRLYKGKQKLRKLLINKGINI